LEAQRLPFAMAPSAIASSPKHVCTSRHASDAHPGKRVDRRLHAAWLRGAAPGAPVRRRTGVGV